MEIGTRIRIISNGTGIGGTIHHYFPIGAIATITYIDNDDSTLLVEDATGFSQWVSVSQITPYNF